MTLELNPRFSIGDKVYTRRFENYRERYYIDEHIVKDIHVEYNTSSNSIEYSYIFEDAKNPTTRYVDKDGSLAASPEEIYAKILEELKSVLPTGMQEYLRNNL